MSLPGEPGRPAPAQGETVPPAAAPAPSAELRLTVPAEPVSASLVRDRLRRWLGALRWPSDRLRDVLMAVNEAASNSIEHAYPPGTAGTVEVHGRLTAGPDGRHVELTVRDHGAWRPVPEDNEGRRRGIPLMRACMDKVTITSDRQGTWVRLRSAVVPDAGRSC